MVYGLLQGRDLKLDVKSFGKQSFHSDLPVKGRKFLYQFTKEGETFEEYNKRKQNMKWWRKIIERWKNRRKYRRLYGRNRGNE